MKMMFVLKKHDTFATCHLKYLQRPQIRNCDQYSKYLVSKFLLFTFISAHVKIERLYTLQVINKRLFFAIYENFYPNTTSCIAEHL